MPKDNDEVQQPSAPPADASQAEASPPTYMQTLSQELKQLSEKTEPITPEEKQLMGNKLGQLGQMIQTTGEELPALEGQDRADPQLHSANLRGNSNLLLGKDTLSDGIENFAQNDTLTKNFFRNVSNSLNDYVASGQDKVFGDKLAQKATGMSDDALQKLSGLAPQSGLGNALNAGKAALTAKPGQDKNDKKSKYADEMEAFSLIDKEGNAKLPKDEGEAMAQLIYQALMAMMMALKFAGSVTGLDKKMDQANDAINQRFDKLGNDIQKKMDAGLGKISDTLGLGKIGETLGFGKGKDKDNASSGAAPQSLLLRGINAVGNTFFGAWNKAMGGLKDENSPALPSRPAAGSKPSAPKPSASSPMPPSSSGSGSSRPKSPLLGPINAIGDAFFGAWNKAMGGLKDENSPKSSQKKSESGAQDIAKDPAVKEGAKKAGTAVGTAVGGPIGGMVGGVVAKKGLEKGAQKLDQGGSSKPGGAGGKPSSGGNPISAGVKSAAEGIGSVAKALADGLEEGMQQGAGGNEASSSPSSSSLGSLEELSKKLDDVINALTKVTDSLTKSINPSSPGGAGKSEGAQGNGASLSRSSSLNFSGGHKGGPSAKSMTSKPIKPSENKDPSKANSKSKMRPNIGRPN